ncbi:MAG: methyltransferase type 12 [Frondihabitans sp.]|nr:methyltransferase type 12 [Frondihabitans sp.]
MTNDPSHDEHPFDRTYWEDRYGAPGLAWSGNPNPVLVTEATSLTPGRALDVGSGEGGDALWLATRGWQVTGIDIAVNALDKARARVESVDRSAAARIDWQQHDLTAWAPDPESFDLVSSQFMHLPEPARGTLFRALAAAVAPGGTLLIVGHDVSVADGAHPAHFLSLMFDVDDVVAAIDGEGLRVDVAEVRARAAGGGEALRDVVVRATRTA